LVSNLKTVPQVWHDVPTTPQIGFFLQHGFGTKAVTCFFFNKKFLLFTGDAFCGLGGGGTNFPKKKKKHILSHQKGLRRTPLVCFLQFDFPTPHKKGPRPPKCFFFPLWGPGGWSTAQRPYSKCVVFWLGLIVVFPPQVSSFKTP